jgi:hypothetical protein
MGILPDAPRHRSASDLSHLVVSTTPSAEGDVIQIHNTKLHSALTGSFPLDVAVGISRVLHQGDEGAVELATRLDRSIAEAVYATVARTMQGQR